MKRRLAGMCPARRIRIRTRSGLELLLLKVAAELGMVFDVNVGITLSDDAHDINVVGELDETERLGDKPRSDCEEERNGNAEPEVRRTEQVVRVSTRKSKVSISQLTTK